LAVQNFCIYPLNDWSNIHNYIKRHEVLSFHTVSQPHIFLMLSPKRQSRSPFIQCYCQGLLLVLLQNVTIFWLADLFVHASALLRQW
jgi:hypothetical protein